MNEGPKNTRKYSDEYRLSHQPDASRHPSWPGGVIAGGWLFQPKLPLTLIGPCEVLLTVIKRHRPEDVINRKLLCELRFQP